ncbi:hypothetical protein [Algoriphagus vanfongensis]|uniref:hypothetical protein n=1 Tax=Algoriphagus vanfongensis TaxID=426371 RepID=UPI0004788C80|nr:hypothetical protein [Algoriphagus vanfongensis]
MELKEFIKQSLTQIAQGVKESQEDLLEVGAIVVPDKTYKNADSFFIKTDSIGRQEVTEINFKIGVTINESSESKGGIGVMSGFLNIGGSIESGNSNQNVNTIEFTIPMVLPSVDVIELQRKKRFDSSK